MNYLVLLDENGVAHVVWCGLINDATVAAWQASRGARWCACAAHVVGQVLCAEAPPTCIACVSNLHEYAQSRYDGHGDRIPPDA